MDQILNYIGGELVPPKSSTYLDNFEPAIGTVYSQVPDSDAADIQAAVDAAEAAFPAWSQMPVAERSAVLLDISRRILESISDLAEAESRDTGKPVSLAKAVDIPRSFQNFDFFATAIKHVENESHQTDREAINYTLRDPLGVVGCISPWNLPLYLFSWKIAPALAAGNTVVAKPSELTPMTAYMLSQICMEAGLPPGVLNIVHGLGNKSGAAIVEHPAVKAISFTGGTNTGAEIARVAAPQFKKLSLELGGKNPTIIFTDCPHEDTLDTVARSAFSNQGEICLCGSRIFIQRELYEDFRDDLVDKVREMKIGDPKDEGTDQGSLVSQQHMEKVLSYIQLAKDEGGRILTGGEREIVPGRCENGWFVQPTIIEGLDHTCRTNQEEIFGPVITLTPFDTEDEVVAMANSTPYGLSASVWTENLTRAHRISQRLASGLVWVNCWMLRDLRTPFGGVKQSGVGREGGWEALRFFTEPKNVCIKLR